MWKCIGFYHDSSFTRGEGELEGCRDDTQNTGKYLEEQQVQSGTL